MEFCHIIGLWREWQRGRGQLPFFPKFWAVGKLSSCRRIFCPKVQNLSRKTTISAKFRGKIEILNIRISLSEICSCLSENFNFPGYFRTRDAPVLMSRHRLGVMWQNSLSLFQRWKHSRIGLICGQWRNYTGGKRRHLQRGASLRGSVLFKTVSPFSISD